MTQLLTKFEGPSGTLNSIYDISTPEKRAKAYTQNILMDYARYAFDESEDANPLRFNDTHEGRLFEMLLSQLWSHREDAWKIPAPEVSPLNQNESMHRDEDYSCLAEWLVRYVSQHERSILKGSWLENSPTWYRTDYEAEVAEAWSPWIEDEGCR